MEELLGAVNCSMVVKNSTKLDLDANVTVRQNKQEKISSREIGLEPLKLLHVPPNSSLPAACDEL